MTIAANIRRLRKGIGITQTELACRSGVTAATISRIESGAVQEPKLSQLLKLSRALSVGVDDLVDSSAQGADAMWEQAAVEWLRLGLEEKHQVINLMRILAKDNASGISDMEIAGLIRALERARNLVAASMPDDRERESIWQDVYHDLTNQLCMLRKDPLK